MWQHKQEERELKRIEGDIVKKQRQLTNTMQEYENGNLCIFCFYLLEIFFLSILIIIYKDNNKDDTTGSKLIVIYPVAITQRGASERYVPSQGWVREKGKGVKLGKTMIRENLHTLVQGEMVSKSKDTCT